MCARNPVQIIFSGGGGGNRAGGNACFKCGEVLICVCVCVHVCQRTESHHPICLRCLSCIDFLSGSMFSVFLSISSFAFWLIVVSSTKSLFVLITLFTYQFFAFARMRVRRGTSHLIAHKVEVVVAVEVVAVSVVAGTYPFTSLATTPRLCITFPYRLPHFPWILDILTNVFRVLQSFALSLPPFIIFYLPFPHCIFRVGELWCFKSQ
jgi:hypothetical protein